LDAVFATPQERAAAVASAEILGVSFHGLFLEADLGKRIARLARRSRDASDADAGVARRQEGYDLCALNSARLDAPNTPEADPSRSAEGDDPMRIGGSAWRQTISTGYVTEIAKEGRSSAVGLYVTSFYAGGSMGAFLPGLAWDWDGWPATIAMVLAMLAVALEPFPLSMKRIRRCGNS